MVLLIDDQRIIGESVRSMLESESDIVFHFCQDPTEAVAKALEVHPTVILQDLVMPELDGLELVRRFRVEKGLAAARTANHARSRPAKLSRPPGPDAPFRARRVIGCKEAQPAARPPLHMDSCIEATRLEQYHLAESNPFAGQEP